MKLDQLSATAEIVSAIAIVATLGYLAIQTQQNTIAVQAGVRQAIFEAEAELLALQIQYPIIPIARDTDIELTVEQAYQFDAYLNSVIRSRESQWLQYQNGVIDERTWTTHRRLLGFLFSNDRARTWWERVSAAGAFDDEFREMVDELLADERARRESRESAP